MQKTKKLITATFPITILLTLFRLHINTLSTFYHFTISHIFISFFLSIHNNILFFIAFYSLNKHHTIPYCFIKRASPGIEPGPPAPKAGILPLNYKANTIQFFLLYIYSYIKMQRREKGPKKREYD